MTSSNNSEVDSTPDKKNYTFSFCKWAQTWIRGTKEKKILKCKITNLENIQYVTRCFWRDLKSKYASWD